MTVLWLIQARRNNNSRKKWYFFLWLEDSVPLLNNAGEAGEYR
jgi:hypothetical protein